MSTLEVASSVPRDSMAISAKPLSTVQKRFQVWVVEGLVELIGVGNLCFVGRGQ